MVASLLLASARAPSADARPDIIAANKALGRGMNLGNTLEAPTEGEWGMKIEPEYLKAIKAAGLDSVGVPVKWSAHAAADAPYAIDPDFFRRIDLDARQQGQVGTELFQTLVQAGRRIGHSTSPYTTVTPPPILRIICRFVARNV